MLSTSPLLHSPSPHWHSLFPPQKVQFMVASLGNGSTVSQKTCSLTPLSTRGDDSELCPWHCCYNVFGTLEFLFMWVFKWFWCPVMWCRDHLSFPRWRGHRDRDAGCDPVWLRARLSRLRFSQKLVIASTGKALPRPWPWAQFTCSGSALKNAPAQELLPEGHCLALKVTETC